jgi:hypothetical protein
VISKLGSLAMEGVGIDIRLGSSTEGGEERDRADISLSNSVEVVESSPKAGFNSSGGKPTLLVSPVRGLLLLNLELFLNEVLMPVL